MHLTGTKSKAEMIIETKLLNMACFSLFIEQTETCHIQEFIVVLFIHRTFSLTNHLNEKNCMHQKEFDRLIVQRFNNIKSISELF